MQIIVSSNIIVSCPSDCDCIAIKTIQGKVRFYTEVVVLCRPSSRFYELLIRDFIVHLSMYLGMQHSK